jgi:hypothetical protein
MAEDVWPQKAQKEHKKERMAKAGCGNQDERHRNLHFIIRHSAFLIPPPLLSSFVPLVAKPLLGFCVSCAFSRPSFWHLTGVPLWPDGHSAQTIEAGSNCGEQ